MENPKKQKKSVLGRGLGALIPGITDSEEKITESKDYFMCDIDLIRSNPYQPRISFNEEELQELSDSINEIGVLQPLLVREADEGYELIAGERRLRASKMAGLTSVPVVVKPATNREMLEISIIENIQRSDLNPLEESDSYHRLMAEFGLTQNEAAERVGKSRSAVANFLRLRNLPDQIKDAIKSDTVSMGHARALLGLDNHSQQLAAFSEIVSKSLSVRQTEALIKRIKSEKEEKPSQKQEPDATWVNEIADNLSKKFGTKVQIKRKGNRGIVAIEFYSSDDLDRLVGLFQSSDY
jgi:ParB family chromosome partitioning protein